MSSSAIVVTELAVSTGTSMAVATSVNAEPLLTSLITFGVSLVTLVGGELIKFLVAYLKKKTNDLKEKDEGENKDENKK